MIKDLLKRDTVMVTPANVFYTSKGEKFEYNKQTQYKYQDYYEKVVCKNLKNPILIEHSNNWWKMWGVAFRYNEKAKCVLIYPMGCEQNTIKSYKEHPHLYLEHKFWYCRGIKVFFGNGSVTNLYQCKLASGKIQYYVINPKFIATSRNYNNEETEYLAITCPYPFLLNDGYSLTSVKNLDILNQKDKNNNSPIMLLDSVDDLDASVHGFRQNKSHKLWTYNDGNLCDIGWNRLWGIDSSNKYDNKFCPETITLFKQLYGWDNYWSSMYKTCKTFRDKYDKQEITCWYDLIDFIQLPNTNLDSYNQSLVTRENNKQTLAEKARDFIGDLDASITKIDRQGDTIMFAHRINERCSNYFEMDAKTGKKKLLTLQGSTASQPVPKAQLVLESFPSSTCTKSGCNWNERESYLAYNKVQFCKPFEEIFQGTTLGYLVEHYGEVQIDDYELYKYNPDSRWVTNASTKICSIKSLVQGKFSNRALDLLLTQRNVFYEQLLKTNNIGLFLAIILCGGLDNSCIYDIAKRKTEHYWGDDLLEINSKGKNLKETFGLSLKQIGIINEWCMNQVDHRYDNNEYHSYSSCQLLPPTHGIKVLFPEINTVDDATFKEILTQVTKNQGRNYYDSWNYKEYQRNAAIAEMMKDMTPKERLHFIIKFPDPREYADYLNMRTQLEALAERIHRPELWDPKVYTIKVKDEVTLKHLHDYVQDIVTRYQDEARAAAFDKALLRVKDWIWIDDKEELCLIPPKSISDLTREGSELHHCVGTFVGPIANGTTNVLFIRKQSEPDVPYFTMEILNDGTVRQVHGLQNCQPTSEIIEFLLRWAKAHKKTVVEQSVRSTYGMLCANR